jgi:hypothetical protein
MRTPLGWLLIPLLMAGCSTEYVQPQIETFAQSVDASTATALQRYAAEGIALRYREEYHREMANRSLASNQPVLVYQFDKGGCDRAISLAVSLEDPALADFANHCRLVIIEFDPVSNTYRSVDPLEIRPPDDQEGVRGENARRVAEALRGYANALAELAAADTPQAVGASFGMAALAVQNLGAEARKLKGGENLPPPDARFGAGSALVQTVLTEVLEAKRYRLLKLLVTEADRTVEISARSLAAWYQEQSAEEIRAAYGTLHEAVTAAQEAVIAQSPDRAGLLAAVREAYEAVEVVETNAPWRVFLGIAEGHRAILQSLNAPASLEQLAAANQRIARLVDQTHSFVESIDAHKNKP